MRILAQSELMKNQKHAVVMGPQHDFQVLQTLEGDALFFSIGDNGVFYMTREARASESGWDRINLCHTLPKGHSNAATGSAKAFAVSQNPQNLAVDVALVLTQGGSDSLYISKNNPTTTDHWRERVSWIPIPFDSTSIPVPSSLQIVDLYMMTMPSEGGPGTLTCFVDILRAHSDGFQFLDRYNIEPDLTVKWVKHTLPNNVEAGSISSCLGRRPEDPVSGIYTFGKIGGSTSLIFTPAKNVWSAHSPPKSARLVHPTRTTSIASTLNKDRCTNLFVAAEGGLYLFQPNQQKEGATPTLVLPSSPVCGTNTFAGTSTLRAGTVGKSTAVWGLNPQQDLVYTTCPTGHEADPKMWSAPIRICSKVLHFAFYLNIKASMNILFAQVEGGKLLQLTQDPGISTWCQRSITLPTTYLDDIVECTTFTSHVRITDDNGMLASEKFVSIRSTQPVSVYINNVYFKLDSSSSVEVKTDATGSLVIIQETNSLPAICLQVICEDQTVKLDPQSKLIEKLSTVTSGDVLTKIRITDAQGDTHPLVSPDVSDNDKQVVASCVSQLLKARSTLPSDGSMKATTLETRASMLEASYWGVARDTKTNALRYIEGNNSCLSLLFNQTGRSSLPVVELVADDALGAISTAAGDLFNFLRSVWENVESFIVKEINGISQFFARIGGKIYTTVLDCLTAVSDAIEFVFKHINVFFEKLVAWLGFLFNWDDILRTHRVIKNVLRQYTRKLVDEVDNLEDQVHRGFEELKQNIHSWADLPDSGQTVAEQQRNAPEVPGSDSPQCNWALYHTANAFPKIDQNVRYERREASNADGDWQPLINTLDEEKKVIMNTGKQIKELAGQIQTMSPIKIIQKIIGISGEFIVGSAENLVLELLEVVKQVIKGIWELLDAPLEIPIISPIYKMITKGDTLSCLDLVSLIAAIPGTIIFKLLTSHTPFPNNPYTRSLSMASSFSEISSLLSEEQSSYYLMSSLQAEKQDTLKLTPYQQLTGVLKLSSVPIGYASLWLGFYNRAVGNTSSQIRGISVALWVANATPAISANFPTPSGWTLFGDGIMTAGFIKIIVDNSSLSVRPWKDYISPIMTAVLGLLGLSPSIGGYIAKKEHKTSDGLALTASIFSSVGSVLYLGTLKEFGPEIVATSIVLSSGCAVIGNSVSTISGVSLLSGA
jgi:hypothetical protein